LYIFVIDINLVYIWYIFRLDLVYSLQEGLATLQVTIFQCYRRTWWGIIQCSSPSNWIRQRLTHS